MKVIGIAGFARCGKDTFVNIAINILKRNNYTPIRFAFADTLKDEVECMLKQNKFATTVYTDDTAAKSLIRPLMVWWGCQRRTESQGMYWVNEVNEQIQALVNDAHVGGASSDNLVALISDVRFPNEAKWVQETWKGNVIHLKKWQMKELPVAHDIRKVYDSAPNEEEAKNDPMVEDLADVRTEWESQGIKNMLEASAIPVLQNVVLNALNQTKHFNGKLTL